MPILLSRNWVFTLNGNNNKAFIEKQSQTTKFKDVTFLQLNNNNGLIVMKNQVWANVIRKLLGVTDVILVSSAKNIRNAMKNVTFSYGKILNRAEKRLANKSADYGKTIREFAAKHDLLPENDPRLGNQNCKLRSVLRRNLNISPQMHHISPQHFHEFKFWHSLQKIHLQICIFLS